MMLRVLLISALAVVSLAAPKLDTKLDKLWDLWKSGQNRLYDNKNEELYRRTVWEKNFYTVAMHNMEHDMDMHTYRLGMNSFADMTVEEFVKQRNGLLQSKTKKPANRQIFDAKNVNVAVPDTKDWRDDGYVTDIKDQGQCGSCWSFSATGSLEGQYFRAKGTLVSFSEQQLVDCSGPEGDYGCNGGLMDDAFKYIETHKLEDEEDYPYEARDDTCRDDESKGLVEVSNYVDVTAGSEDDLKVACGTNGPVSVAIDASHTSFQLYQSGVYTEPDCSSSQLDHGVLVVGYGTDADSGKDYWLVKNSWGTQWGDEGYIKMERNNRNQCGVASQASYPIVKN